MRILLDKALNSLEASTYLQNDEFYAASVHCSYYSCIQLMRHVLFNVDAQKLDEEEFDNSDEVKNVGSHQFLFNKIIQCFYAIGGNHNTQEFKSWFYKIKNLRIEADYRQIVCSKPDSKIAYTFAVNIRNEIYKLYSL